MYELPPENTPGLRSWVVHQPREFVPTRTQHDDTRAAAVTTAIQYYRQSVDIIRPHNSTASAAFSAPVPAGLRTVNTVLGLVPTAAVGLLKKATTAVTPQMARVESRSSCRQ